jgi:peroxiredoxin
LRRDYEQFRERDAEILSIGAQGRAAFKRYWDHGKFPFPGLSDPRKQVLQQYGQQFKILRFGRMPGVVIVDKQGRMRFEHHGSWQDDIPTNNEILQVLDRLNAEDGAERVTSRGAGEGDDSRRES